MGGVSFFSFGKDAVFVESMFSERIFLSGIEEVVDLPFSGYECLIASILEDPGDGNFTVPIEIAATINCWVMMRVPARTVWIATRQEADSSCAADGRDIEISKFDTGSREAVDIGCHIFLTAVTAKPIFADIIEQDE